MKYHACEHVHVQVDRSGLHLAVLSDLATASKSSQGRGDDSAGDVNAGWTPGG